MTTKLVKSTPKGQITLPKIWRKKFNTDSFILTMKESTIEIKPVDLEELTESDEVIFDAKRDNGGKGITPDEMISMLKKIRRELN